MEDADVMAGHLFTLSLTVHGVM